MRPSPSGVASGALTIPGRTVFGLVLSALAGCGGDGPPPAIDSPPPIRLVDHLDRAAIRSPLLGPVRALTNRLYDEEVRYLNARIGDFLDALRRTGLYDEALIAFVSDHGETPLDPIRLPAARQRQPARRADPGAADRQAACR